MGDHGKLADIGACVFDAYGTLFDFAAAAQRERDALGDKAPRLTAIWRDKQLQYTWLRSLMAEYTDFWTVTSDALDYALAALEIDDADLRKRLLDLYWTLDTYEEVPETLKILGERGFKLAILSNGSPPMLAE